MQQRDVGFDIHTTALLKRGYDIDKQLRAITRVKALDELLQEALDKKRHDEQHISQVRAASDDVRKVFKEKVETVEVEDTVDIEALRGRVQEIE